MHNQVSLIPVIEDKPTQQAIRTVRSVGLNPDLIVCRCTDQLSYSTIEKVANHCEVDLDQVIIPDVSSTYLVPLTLEEQGLVYISRILNLRSLNTPPGQIIRGAQTWTLWKTLVQPREYLERVTIALVGKYTGSLDVYMSLVKSLQHANMACYRRLDLVLIDASRLEYPNTEYEDLWLKVRTTQGILVPGGFGARGTEGMIDVIRYARENKVPFMGICLGMQLVVVEFARNVCSLSANSAEMDKQTPHPVVVDMPEIDFSKYGGTMRLGEKLTVFEPSSSSWSKVHAAYAGYSYQLHGDNNIESLAIQGRHRHHCGVNPLYIETLAEHGLVLVGKDEKGERMEILELRNHPWFVGVQFHPEYRSKVLIPAYQS